MTLVPESTHLIRDLFESRELVDLAEGAEEKRKIDVIIPVLHSNDLWRENLLSFYREIPINRILIGDAGCIDDTILIAQEFPRVEVIDHLNISTLGSSIADLISRVVTPKFAYLQSDVYLPEGWFLAMESKSQSFPWVGCPMQVVTMLDYRVDYTGTRPLAGAQLGNTSVFSGLKDFIDDDYVYRQEDFVLEEFVRRKGFETGNTLDTYHFHQVMRRKTTGMRMDVVSVNVNLAESLYENNRVRDTQLYGLIKYCDPKQSEVRLAAFGAFSNQVNFSLVQFKEILEFSRHNQILWVPLILRFGLRSLIEKVIQVVGGLLLRMTDRVLKIR